MSSALALRATVASMLAREGVAVTMARATGGTYNEDTGTVTPTSGEEGGSYPGMARIGEYRDSVIDGTVIRSGDRRVTFQPADWTYEPTNGDTISAQGLTVVGVKKRELGGTPFSFTLQMRKGGE